MNQLISAAVGEKLASLLTVEYLRERGGVGKRSAYEKVLRRVRNVSPEERAAQQGDEADEAGLTSELRCLFPVLGRHVASAGKRPRASDRSRIGEPGVLRQWQSEDSVGPFFSPSALQWAWLCSAMQQRARIEPHELGMSAV